MPNCAYTTLVKNDLKTGLEGFLIEVLRKPCD